jgi:tRNA G18 (ribose-2'-O)-methylase SpoU
MQAITPITDPEDPRIEAYRHMRERDLVGRQGGFIAEGAVVLRVLLTRSPHETHSVLIADRLLEAQGDLLALVPAHVPIYAAPQAMFDRIAGFPIHRGILAEGRRIDPGDARSLLGSAGGHVLVLFGIANHDNIGGIFRNAAAFGVGAVLLDRQCCDPLYRKAIRVSVGGTLVVPFQRIGPDEDALGLIEQAGFHALALSPRGTTPLADLAAPPRAAILLGSEGPGLPDAILARAQTITIPMAGGFDSLNVATTSGIVLHHLRHFAQSSPVTLGVGS